MYSSLSKDARIALKKKIELRQKQARAALFFDLKPPIRYTLPKRTSSKLPLIFSNGLPTSLEKMSEFQLENFVLFMLKCAQCTYGPDDHIGTFPPKWWPTYVPFTVKRPDSYLGIWENQLRSIVRICYEANKSKFVIELSDKLADYKSYGLRFLDVGDGTVLICERKTDKLFATVRKEMFEYDQRPKQMYHRMVQESKMKLCIFNKKFDNRMIEIPADDITISYNQYPELKL